MIVPHFVNADYPGVTIPDDAVVCLIGSWFLWRDSDGCLHQEVFADVNLAPAEISELDP